MRQARSPPRTRALPPPRPCLRSELLTDGRTRVVSECSVFYTADAWLHAHDGGSWTQQSRLAAAVRVPQLRPTYLLGVAAQADWFTRFVAPSEVRRGRCPLLPVPGSQPAGAAACQQLRRRQASPGAPARC